MTKLTFMYQAAFDQSGFSAGRLRERGLLHAELRDDTELSVENDTPSAVHIHLQLGEVEAAYREQYLTGAEVQMVGAHGGFTFDARIEKVRLDPRTRKIYSLDMSVIKRETIDQ